ncbi:MCE family protein [Mycolicibacterium setense]
MSTHLTRVGVVLVLVGLLVAGVAVTLDWPARTHRIHITAHFANSNGLYVGDEVRILGVPVGEVEAITPGPDGAAVKFWYSSRFRVPAQAEAAILSPGLVSARIVQLTPAYTGGEIMTDAATIPADRTAVPAEYDDLRQQLEKLNDSLQPARPDGLSPAGAVITTAADNLRGQGADIRTAMTQLSDALSALGDHSGDIAGTVKGLSTLVSALQSSRDVLGALNQNLATVTGYLADDPKAIGSAVIDLNTALVDIQEFLNDNRDTLGTTLDKTASLSASLQQALPDLKQILHVTPNALANFTAAYRPYSASVAGTFAVNNFANPLQFICGAIQAASRLNYEKSSKLCVQYLAPIFKNRQYNFPPIGTTLGMAQLPIPLPLPLPIPVPFPPFIIPTLALMLLPIPLPVAGVIARPNEITYSEDWMRPDYRQPSPPQPTAAPVGDPPLPAETLPADAPTGITVEPGLPASSPAPEQPAPANTTGAGS